MEKNKFKRAWIWFWYSDYTRFAVLFGLPVIPVLLLFGCVFGVGEYLRVVATVTYMFIFAWALFDNDYSNLRRIGLDEFRRKI